MKDFYRKSSLEKLSSPEQLDRMIVITSPLFWLAMVGALVVVASALVWAFRGEVAVVVGAEGIYLHKDGLSTIYTQKRETVTDSSETVLQEFEWLGGEDSEDIVVCYVPLGTGKSILPGMSAMVSPSTVDSQEVGYILAEVQHVEEYVTSYEDVIAHLQDETLAGSFVQGPVVAVVCRLERDENTASGLAWSSSRAKNIRLNQGTLVSVSIVTEEKTPISLLFPMLEQGAAAG